MARRRVIEIICDRCGKTENQAPGKDDNMEEPEFEARFRDREVKFNDLCHACRKALGNYMSKLARDPSPKKDGPIPDVPQIEKSASGKEDKKKVHIKTP